MTSKVNFTIDQGTDFFMQVIVTNDDDTPFDFTDYTVNAVMRKHYTEPTAVEFTANGMPGILTLSLAPGDTLGLDYGKYVYDVVLTSQSNTVTRLFEGIATVVPSATAVVAANTDTNTAPLANGDIIQ